jgi:broad specificity phosphatase PhoE
MTLSPGVVILVRHGEPALSRKVRLNANEYRDWWARYEAGGLKAGQTPPQALLEVARSAGLVLSSTRRRSIESAEAIGDGRAFESEALFIEAPLPPPALPSWIRLPPRWWGVIARIWWWAFDHHPDSESFGEAKARARAAAHRLMDLAKRDGPVLVVAHGFFNRMIGVELQALGWRRTLNQGYRYWRARRFEAPAEPARALEAPQL